MPEVNTFACDVCGAQKREANRWWIVRGITPGLVEIREFIAEAWASLRLDSSSRLAAACGEEHALQLAGRWMIAGSFDSPAARPISAKSLDSTEPSSPGKETPNG